ncbi:capsular polysaccharide biosynthesis protein [Neorhizobium sp. 2083]|uniref:Wzz/FepE/Etk N-terminal domain-containing protein n=1 Tax=Neorhizobium sp. 2083 TaxID=2817762 RepID=UPI002866FE62|nr:Wzz/FepE/Etk N-terminal domain-containing protein [Neorhizobium sp. 2083]MDR6817508.1 capsular polysaccharide biosynthesis protein [Neorhizobium sp. 2083]
MSVLAWRNKIRLGVFTSVGLLVAIAYAQSLPRVYNATATLLLEPRQFASAGRDLAQQTLDLNNADSEVQIIRSERLLTAVFDGLTLQSDAELGLSPPKAYDGLAVQMQDAVSSLMRDGFKTQNEAPKSAIEDATPPAPSAKPPDPKAENSAEERRVAFANFAKRLSVRRVGQSYVVEVEFWSYNPELPARVANAIVSGYILQSVLAKEQTARAATDTLQGRLDMLSAQIGAAREAIQKGTLPSIPTPDADGRIIGAALPPIGPSGPRTSLIAALGGLLGLFAAMSMVAYNVAFDRRVRDAKELARETGIPCLATVPNAPKADLIAWYDDSPAVRHYASVIRDLRTSVDLASAPQRRDRNIAVALIGAAPSVGVSMLSFSLAQLLSRSGRHVTFFHSTMPPIKEDMVLPSTSLAEVAISGLWVDQPSFGHRDGILLLPIHSHILHTNLFADFRHPSVLQLLEAARLKGDVVFDLPSLSSSMDALALAFHADAVLIVARSGKTTIEEVKDVYNLLRRAGSMVTGTVINRARS